MAELIQVFGAVTVKVGTGSAGALETLTAGGTRNGANLNFDGFWGDVHADMNGGDEGPPIDVQYFGETCRIELVLTKWDAAIGNRVAVRVKDTTSGFNATPGTLMIQGGFYIRTLILSGSGAFNFPICVYREPIVINKGTKHSTLVLTATAYKTQANGNLFNAETS